MTIGEIDRKVARQFPMAGSDMPTDVRITADEWVAVVDWAIQLVERPRRAGERLRRRPRAAARMRDTGDLAMITDAMLRRGYSEERIRFLRQSAAGIPSGQRRRAMSQFVTAI
jgi:membrane dipeptidase